MDFFLKLNVLECECGAGPGLNVLEPKGSLEIKVLSAGKCTTST